MSHGQRTVAGLYRHANGTPVNGYKVHLHLHVDYNETKTATTECSSWDE